MTHNKHYQVQHFFDQETWTLSYVVYDQSSKDAVLIDPVLNYDPASSKYSYESVNEVLDFIKNHDLKIHYIMDTHAHADHVTGMKEIKKHLPEAKTVIGKHIDLVQAVFKDIFNLKDLSPVEQVFDILADEEKDLQAGTLNIKTIFTPGHTPACASYLIGDAVFTGDALFMPDFGTGRCDFPKGSAEDLYHSVHDKLYALPDETRVFTGHDYMPGGRELKFESSIKEQKENNIQLKENTSKEEFIAFRTERDRQLKAPRLLLPSIQLNIRAGNFPQAEDNGTSYIKMPLFKK
ncbi:MAG TPA: MBL fold metallo-hydrolase [Oligoflexia bacterium]|nr:MBL fold metallo-hydrolase [Oligoflexia bacterium]HMR25069.1 MBL fold metallo-hydrolase [Oligoflexia bacterium]